MIIKDLQTGTSHEYGSNRHDSLIVSEDGRTLSYYNLQNGDGSRFGEYRFVTEDEGEETGIYWNIGGFRSEKIIHCRDCKYYDPPHVMKDGVRYEYQDLPEDAFDGLMGFVHIGYGINVGGRCTRDYNAGYTEDKRVFVSDENYCGRAERQKANILQIKSGGDR